MSLSTTTQNLRILACLKAIELMAQGLSKTVACEQSGITLYQFNNWMARDNGAIEGLQQAIVEGERIRLAQLANAQAVIINQLIETVTTPGTSALVQLKALKYIDDLQARLEGKHNVNSESDNAADYLALHGPQTRVEESKMVTVTIQSNPDGSVDVSVPVKPDIVDRNFED